MISIPREQDCAEHVESSCSFARIFSRSFLAAHLLTGSSQRAETAVMTAISVWNPLEEDEDELFMVTLRTAARREMKASRVKLHEEATSCLCLPIELRRVLKLSPRQRRCFVLRVLIGLPAAVCAQILIMDVLHLERYSRQAIKSLIVLTNREHN